MSTPSPKPPYWKATIPNGRRRAPWHDYHARCIYMVTANKHAAAPTFGRLIIPEDLTQAYIDSSAAGKIIIDAIRDTPSHNPEIRILEFGLMPDHFHLLLFVTRPMRRTLGEIVQAIKATVTRKVREEYQSPDLVVFEPGFHDRILMHEGQLATLYQYIRDNPRRLAVRQRYPEHFRRVNALEIRGKSYHAYGNFQLLEYPFKQQVLVHRHYSDEENHRLKSQWLYTAANGGVLVSPFISPAEKAIRTEAEALGARFILIINEQMDARYKPSGSDFNLCETGRMLIISADLPTPLSRQSCLAMNSLAERICQETQTQG